ncbi:MAG: lipoyl(octanoyl) transferase LipB [candidate division Zixibacteria bacterium]|nr:lipoyl(octanoyl) transferase LipB [candidate division Zixibacteria bacterium]
MPLNLINLQKTKYKPTWDIQKNLVKRRADGKIDDCLIVTEHEPVITMGRATDYDNLLVDKEDLRKKGVDLHEIERGGDITFHGPGQIVLYPIINLRKRGRDVHQYLRDLEEFTITALIDIGLEASVKEGLTGIWVDNYKIGAIGVAVSRWITYHGIAINVTTDLDYFKLINPCGITEYPVGSLSQLLGKDVNMEQVNKLLVRNFADFFGYKNVKAIDEINSLII